MGSPMAGHILENGYPLYINTRTREKAEALSTATDALGGGFPQNNAVVYLVDAAQGKGDVSFCADILSALEGYSPSAEDEGEFTDFLAQLRGYCA